MEKSILTMREKSEIIFIEERKLLRSFDANENTGTVELTAKQNVKEHHLKLTKSINRGNLKAEAIYQGLAQNKLASALRGNTATGEVKQCFFVCSAAELEKAYKTTVLGKRKYKKIHGQFSEVEFLLPDQEREYNALSRFQHNKDTELPHLHNDLINGTYEMSPYTAVVIPRKGKSPRILLVPVPRDRIVFNLTRERVKPILQFMDSYNVFGSARHPRLPKIINILEQVREAMKNNSHILKIDIKDFFPSIDREKMLGVLSKYIDDKSILILIRGSFYNQINCDKKYEELVAPLKKKGIPQGCSFSPLFANLYALDLDIFLNSKGITAFRYLDDLIAFTNSRREANNIYTNISRIGNSLGLKIHPLEKGGKKSYISNSHKSIEYLGVIIAHDKFMIPEEAIKDFKNGITQKCNTITIKKFGSNKVMEAIAMYIRGWKEFYGNICIKDYINRSSEINDWLKGYYKKRFASVSDFIKFENVAKYYL